MKDLKETNEDRVTKLIYTPYYTSKRIPTEKGTNGPVKVYTKEEIDEYIKNKK